MPVDRKSRYVKAPRIPWIRGDGSEVELIGLAPHAARASVFSVIATDSDRLDSLASRYYRDPEKLWKIANASDQIDPFDATSPGVPVAIPPDK